MTNKRANEIFREKYPEGTIFKKGEMGGTSSCKYAVVFKDHGKVYDYFQPNYSALLLRLGCITEDEFETIR